MPANESLSINLAALSHRNPAMLMRRCVVVDERTHDAHMYFRLTFACSAGPLFNFFDSTPVTAHVNHHAYEYPGCTYLSKVLGRGPIDFILFILETNLIDTVRFPFPAWHTSDAA